jgi:hypothetical protein
MMLSLQSLLEWWFLTGVARVYKLSKVNIKSEVIGCLEKPSRMPPRLGRLLKDLKRLLKVELASLYVMVLLSTFGRILGWLGFLISSLVLNLI